MTEEAFQRALDAEPENAALRLVFADWLEEQGDLRAAGYRWMGENEKRPHWWCRIAWTWWSESVETFANVPERCRQACLPLKPDKDFRGGKYACFPTRRAADDALALVFHQLQEVPA